MATTAQTGGSSDGGFFSDITDSFKVGFQKIGSDVLPVWAASQIKGQETNKYNQDTIDQSKQARTLGTGTVNQTTGLIKQFPVATMLLVAAGIGVTVLIVKARG
mgnify:CR=1 FL=1